MPFTFTSFLLSASLERARRERVWPRTPCEAKTTKESVKTKTEKGKFFCIRVVKSIKLRLIKLSCPQIWNIEKEKVGRQASEAQREKELERERKNKGDIFGWRNNMKFCSCGEKMRNACIHQDEKERHEKKGEQEHIRHFLHKTCNQEVSGSFTL